jgi:hypothetical protein
MEKSRLQIFGWIALGLLVLLGIASLFLLNTTLGLVFLAYCVVVLYWVFGVLKKKKDKEIRAAANALGLQFKPHPLRYGPIEGDYKGHRVKISYEGGGTLAGGSVAALVTGKPGLAAFDIRNVTLVRLEHRAGRVKRARLRDSQIDVRTDEMRTAIAGVCTEPRALRGALDKLVAAVDRDYAR